jgi:hypothetical protein
LTVCSADGGRCFIARRSIAQAKAARYADTVALFQALGGGWWNRSDVAPERPLSSGDVFQ